MYSLSIDLLRGTLTSRQTQGELRKRTALRHLILCVTGIHTLTFVRGIPPNEEEGITMRALWNMKAVTFDAAPGSQITDCIREAISFSELNGWHDHGESDLDPHFWLDPLRMADVAGVLGRLAQ